MYVRTFEGLGIPSTHHHLGAWTTSRLDSSISGKLFSFNSKHGGSTTAVYVPGAATGTDPVNILVWIHGDLICGGEGANAVSYIKGKTMPLAKQVSDSKQPFVLVVPSMKWKGEHSHVLGLPKTMNAFLEEVRSGLTAAGWTSEPSIGRLIIAGHSRAYAVLNGLAVRVADAESSKGALAKLTDMWLIDTTYGKNHKKYHCDNWVNWAKQKSTSQLHVFFCRKSGTSDVAECIRDEANKAGLTNVHVKDFEPGKLCHCHMPKDQMPGLLDRKVQQSLRSNSRPFLINTAGLRPTTPRYIYTRQLSGFGYALGNSQPTAKQIYAAQSVIRRLDDSTFWNIFSDRNRVVVVSFWSDSSRNSDRVAKIMTEVAQKYRNGVYSRLVNFFHIEWDPKVNPKIFQHFGLKGMPVIYFYFTSTGNPPVRTAPLLEGSLGPTDKWNDPEQYEWRIRNILARHINEVRIILIDLPQFFTGKHDLRNKVINELDAKLNNMLPDDLVKERLIFRVEYRSSEPTLQEKQNFGRLDFPIYFLGGQHSLDTVKKLMGQHQIEKTVQCPRKTQALDSYKEAEEWWEASGRRGLGLPPGQGFRKIGFVRADKIAGDKIALRNLRQAFLNITAHELGHMFNLCHHGKSGLMKSPVSIIEDVDLLGGEMFLAIKDLARLRDLP